MIGERRSSRNSLARAESRICRYLAVATLAAGAASALAQPALIDTEPNDTPQSAARFSAPMTLMGTMPGGDQDAWMWTVSDEDAAHRWRLELAGLPGRLTIVDVARLEYTDTGEVARADRLFKLGSRGGQRSAVADALMFEPGEYLLGLARSGGNAGYRPVTDTLSFDASGGSKSGAAPDDNISIAYRLFITEEPRLPSGTGSEPFARERAMEIRPDRETATLLETEAPAWYRVAFSDEQTMSRWDLHVQVPVGRVVHATLYDAANTKLTANRSDARGRLTLTDISLPAGEYFLEVTPVLAAGEAAGFLQTALLTGTGQRVAGSEAEPNSSWALANRIEDPACCSGRLGEKGDLDFFRYVFQETDVETLKTLTLESASDDRLQLCLLDDRGSTIQCRDGEGTVTMSDLLLTPDTYGVRVSGRNEGTEYRLAFSDGGAIDPSREVEPNDQFRYAVGTPDNHRIKGSFDGRGDVDFYRFVVDDEPQLWRVLVIGDNIADIEYRSVTGNLNQRIAADGNQRRVSLDNLFLMPGTHHISVSGSAAGDYTLLARAIGPPDPNGELEPNDEERHMQTLRIGQTRTGLLSNPNDIDLYKFHLADWDHIRITAVPPADGSLAVELHQDDIDLGEARRIDGEIVLDGVFPPGDYRLSLAPREPGNAEYRVSLERGDRYQCADDCEPNNNPVFASPFPRGRTLTGRSGDWGDLDWYALSGFAEAQEVAFVTDRSHDLRVYDADLNRLDFAFDHPTSAYRGTLPAGERYLMHVGKDKVPDDYTVTMLVGDETAPPPVPGNLPVQISLQLAATTVTPYEQFGQRVTGELSVRSSAAAPLTLAFAAAASDARWRTELAVASATLEPGAVLTVPISIIAPPDVWGDRPVRIAARAVADDGRAASGHADLAVDADALPADPVHAWNIPPALRGGLNVARSAFGAIGSADPMPTSNPATFAELFDGRAAIGYGPSFGGNRDAPQQVTVALAGNRAVPVAGFALNPLYREFKKRTPRDVEFQLSADGVAFQSVLEGKLTMIGTDQYFVLEEPIPATHARLLLTSNWQGQTDGPLTLGEWKVIARPGFDPFAGEGWNIGSPDLGGHVVWNEPAMRGRASSLLTPEDEKLAVRLPEEGALEWVIGFHHERAAQIERIGWIDTAESGRNIDELTLSVSLESPIGPWQPISTWSRTASAETLVLDTPVWARYLRFSVASDPERSYVNLPETLTVQEAVTGDDYRSILGEWGVNSRSAYYESTQPLSVREDLAQRGNESRSSAAPLQPGQAESGQVKLLEQTHWYRPQLPEEHNTLVLTISGTPSVRAELELTAASGEAVALKKMARDSTPDRQVFEAYIEPGLSGLFLEVREPPRSVMFMWDTSPSIGRYRPMVYRSLLAYAGDLVPEVDTANLLPFGAASPLLDEWYGEPYLMQLILNDYGGREGSSAAELANAMATRALAPRPGTKAIVTITDAETSRYPDMWNGMKNVQPRVFSMHVGTGTASQDLMQSWSSVNGGYYSHVIHENEMEIAFERAATMLRRPANYTLSLATEARAAPGPGYLRVVSGESTPARGAVELILDASGSMLQRMQGRRRIEIAKEVLTTAIREQIPAGTPTALRVFGHRTPNACETDLEIPLGPLDPDSTVGRISGIQAKNLARTPIAASLAAVSQDLQGANGPALIVLVTDGEETCDGDPAAVIEQLRESGMEVSLNIVGLAIDDQALADEFAAWARAGGGRYLGAKDQEQLDAAILNALAIPFAVYDGSGSVVASGVVDGEALELEQDVYRVVVGATPSTTYERVEISADERRDLTL